MGSEGFHAVGGFFGSPLFLGGRGFRGLEAPPPSDSPSAPPPPPAPLRPPPKFPLAPPHNNRSLRPWSGLGGEGGGGFMGWEGSMGQGGSKG